MPISKDVDNLAPIALAVVSLAVIVGVGAIVLTQMEGASYTDTTVLNETFNATSDPYNYTVSAASTDGFQGLQSATVYDTTSQNTELTSTIVNSTTVEVSGATDVGDESIDYTYEEESTATDVLGLGTDALSTFGDFFTVIVVIAIAAVLFLLLGTVRRAGGRTMA